MGKANINWDKVETWERLVSSLLAAGFNVGSNPTIPLLAESTESLTSLSPSFVLQQSTTAPRMTPSRTASAYSRRRRMR